MTVKKIPISTLEMKPDFSNIGSNMQNFNVEKVEKWRKLELLDEEGYPTKQTLKVIREWKIDTQKDIEELLFYICIAWHWQVFATHWQAFATDIRPGIWTFGTGGWPGNEDLLSALYQSEAWLKIRYTIELPGGFLCVATTDEAKEEIGKLQDKIVRWGWKPGGKNKWKKLK